LESRATPPDEILEIKLRARRHSRPKIPRRVKAPFLGRRFCMAPPRQNSINVTTLFRHKGKRVFPDVLCATKAARESEIPQGASRLRINRTRECDMICPRGGKIFISWFSSVRARARARWMTISMRFYENCQSAGFRFLRSPFDVSREPPWTPPRNKETNLVIFVLREREREGERGGARAAAGQMEIISSRANFCLRDCRWKFGIMTLRRECVNKNRAQPGNRFLESGTRARDSRVRSCSRRFLIRRNIQRISLSPGLTVGQSHRAIIARDSGRSRRPVRNSQRRMILPAIEQRRQHKNQERSALVAVVVAAHAIGCTIR